MQKRLSLIFAAFRHEIENVCKNIYTYNASQRVETTPERNGGVDCPIYTRVYTHTYVHNTYVCIWAYPTYIHIYIYIYRPPLFTLCIYSTFVLLVRRICYRLRSW